MKDPLRDLSRKELLSNVMRNVERDMKQLSIRSSPFLT